jgi:hypothetical protein
MLVLKLKATGASDLKHFEKRKRQPGLPFSFALTGPKDRKRSVALPEQAGETTPSSRFLPADPLVPGSLQTQLPGPLRES